MEFSNLESKVLFFNMAEILCWPHGVKKNCKYYDLSMIVFKFGLFGGRHLQHLGNSQGTPDNAKLTLDIYR